MVVDSAARIPTPNEIVMLHILSLDDNVIRFVQSQLFDQGFPGAVAEEFVVLHEIGLDRHLDVREVVCRWFRLEVKSYPALRS